MDDDSTLKPDRSYAVPVPFGWNVQVDDVDLHVTEPIIGFLYEEYEAVGTAVWALTPFRILRTCEGGHMEPDVKVLPPGVDA